MNWIEAINSKYSANNFSSSDLAFSFNDKMD